MLVITSNFQYAFSPMCLRKQTLQFLVAGVGEVQVDQFAEIVVVINNLDGGVQSACNGFSSVQTLGSVLHPVCVSHAL